jgi:hypothetical protein
MHFPWSSVAALLLFCSCAKVHSLTPVEHPEPEILMQCPSEVRSDKGIVHHNFVVQSYQLRKPTDLERRRLLFPVTHGTLVVLEVDCRAADTATAQFERKLTKMLLTEAKNISSLGKVFTRRE